MEAAQRKMIFLSPKKPKKNSMSQNHRIFADRYNSSVTRIRYTQDRGADPSRHVIF